MSTGEQKNPFGPDQKPWEELQDADPVNPAPDETQDLDEMPPEDQSKLDEAIEKAGDSTQADIREVTDGE
jgi:hypothetical protein